jgi:hypothetical protein
MIDACDECGNDPCDKSCPAELMREIKKLRSALVRSLEQIRDMYLELDQLRDDNLVLRHSIEHRAKLDSEIKGMLER